jgi:hypothetical protein
VLRQIQRQDELDWYRHTSPVLLFIAVFFSLVVEKNLQVSHFFFSISMCVRLSHQILQIYLCQVVNDVFNHLLRTCGLIRNHSSHTGFILIG